MPTNYYDSTARFSSSSVTRARDRDYEDSLVPSPPSRETQSWLSPAWKTSGTDVPKYPPASKSGPVSQTALVEQARAVAQKTNKGAVSLNSEGEKIYGQIQRLRLSGVSETAAKMMASYVEQHLSGSQPDVTGELTQAEKKSLRPLMESLSKSFPWIDIPVVKKMILYSRQGAGSAAPQSPETTAQALQTNAAESRNSRRDMPPQYGSNAALTDTHLRGEAFEAATENIYTQHMYDPFQDAGAEDALQSSGEKLLSKAKEQERKDELTRAERYRELSSLHPEIAREEIIDLRLMLQSDMMSPQPRDRSFICKALSASICSFYANQKAAQAHDSNCRQAIGELKDLMEKYPGEIPQDMMAYATEAMLAQEKHYKNKSLSFGFGKPKSYDAIPKGIDSTINIRLMLMQRANASQKLFIGSAFAT